MQNPMGHTVYVCSPCMFAPWTNVAEVFVLRSSDLRNALNQTRNRGKAAFLMRNNYINLNSCTMRPSGELRKMTSRL